MVSFLAPMTLSERSRWEASPELEQRLDRIVTTVRNACTDIALPIEEFLRFVGERARGLDPQWLLELPAIDLFLAYACGRGDAAAIAAVETRYFPGVEAIVRDKLGASALADEAMQRMREHLFVGKADAPPHILDYGGRGALSKWLTITAVRAGLRAVRETKRETGLEDVQLGRIVDAAADVELAHLRKRYEPEFKQAFAEAFAMLSSRERNLLRNNVLDGLGVEAIADLHNVNKSTVSRWLARARAHLTKQTRAILRTRLRITASEAESILRLLADQHELTLQTVLRATKH